MLPSTIESLLEQAITSDPPLSVADHTWVCLASAAEALIAGETDLASNLLSHISFTDELYLYYKAVLKYLQSDYIGSKDCLELFMRNLEDHKFLGHACLLMSQIIPYLPGDEWKNVQIKHPLLEKVAKEFEIANKKPRKALFFYYAGEYALQISDEEFPEKYATVAYDNLKKFYRF
jgi:hypothetical protein